MNKKIINGALLGLLVVAAPACSFVSCKDYDDDFAAIRKEIAADKADLVTVKNDLNGQITTLKGQLEAANKKAAEIAVKTVKEWLSENEGQVDRVIFNVFKDEDREIYEAIA